MIVLFKFVDLFAGMGGMRLGLEQALNEKGIEHSCVLTSEIKPHAIAIYKQNFGEENLVGDITQIKGCDIPDFDMLLAGFPCVVGETKIYTDKGYKQIKDIEIGDKVLTHTNTFKSVLEVMSKFSKEVYEVRIGKLCKILITGEHPFYIRKRVNGALSQPEWVKTKELTKDMMVGIPSQIIQDLSVEALRGLSNFNYSNSVYWFKLFSKPKKINKDLMVYNLSVEEDNSYTVNSFIVHNCQPFSSAGKQRGFEDTRGTLFFEVARILKEKKPQYFLLENVENLVRHDLSKEDKKNGKTIGKTLETILYTLKELGYNTNWKVIQASDYGVPQVRRRIYIVGSLNKDISLENFQKKFAPFSIIQEKGIGFQDSFFNQQIRKYLEKNNLSYDYLYDKAIRDKRGSSSNIHSWTLGLRGIVSKEQNDLLEKMVLERRKSELAKKKGVPLKDGVGLTKEELKNIYIGKDLERDISDLLKKGYIKEKSLDTFNDILYDIVGGKLSYEFTKIIDPTKPCLTLVATEVGKLGVVDGEGIRKLTLGEGLRLNGYPENYKFNIEYRKGMDLLGNTVVVPIIKMICERILEDK